MSRFFAVGLAAVATALGFLACGPLFCTEIACRGGLQIDVVDAEGAPVRDFEGEARFDGSVLTIRCGEGQPEVLSEHVECNRDGVVIVDAPANLELELRASGNATSFAGSLAPAYETVHANGEGCPGVCQISTVEVKLQ